LEALLAGRQEAEKAVRVDRDEQKDIATEATIELVQVAKELQHEKAERAQTEETLEETEEELRDKAELLDLAHDTIIVHDMDGRIAFWNRGAEETYGWSRQEALGKISHDLLRTEFPGALVKLTAELIRSGRWEGELMHTARDGRRIIVESRWVLRSDRGGRPAAIMEIDRDVTERRELERLVTKASETERRRFGRDLHDALGQKLTGAGYLIGALAEALENSSPEEADLAERVGEILGECVSEVRAMSRGLAPVGLEEDGLADALDRLAEDVREISDNDCHFRCEQSVLLDTDVATHVFRIAQEAVNNAMKHAHSSEIEIALVREGGEATVSVTDNGAGMREDVPAKGDAGIGMKVMRYRAYAIGGTLSIRDREGGGTVVACTFPAPDPRGQDGEGHG